MKILLKYQERVWYNKNKASPKGEGLEKIRRTLMTNTQELYTRWLSQPDLDDAIKAELVSVAGDNDAIADRFYRDLAFAAHIIFFLSIVHLRFILQKYLTSLPGNI